MLILDWSPNSWDAKEKRSKVVRRKEVKDKRATINAITFMITARVKEITENLEPGLPNEESAAMIVNDAREQGIQLTLGQLEDCVTKGFKKAKVAPTPEQVSRLIVELAPTIGQFLKLIKKPAEVKDDYRILPFPVKLAVPDDESETMVETPDDELKRPWTEAMMRTFGDGPEVNAMAINGIPSLPGTRTVAIRRVGGSRK